MKETYRQIGLVLLIIIIFVVPVYCVGGFDKNKPNPFKQQGRVCVSPGGGIICF